MNKYSKFFYILTACAALCGCTRSVLPKPVLTYDDAGEFRILQLTDLHTIADPSYRELNDSTLQLIERLVRSERPQLIAITGDIIVSGGARPAWEELCALLDKLQTPYFINFGNHDTETDMTKSEIIDLVCREPYCLNDTTLRGTIAGEGNDAFVVYDHTGQLPRNVIYTFDSHAYPQQEGFGTYDWIKFDQIAWYRNVRDAHRDEAGRPLPSLAFFHIPLPEYAAPVDSTCRFGNMLEPVCAPVLNSGVLCNFLEQGDVIGVFVGHDHNNDYLLNLDNKIALAYGRKTGYPSAYEELLERGARMIILQEDSRSFDTYITAPSGRSYLYMFSADDMTVQ
jgi:3',5'-cyclic AMP phosphodiesterase CpdA